MYIKREITNRINSRDILRAFNLNLNNYLIRINTNMNTTRIKFTTTFVKKTIVRAHEKNI